MALVLRAPMPQALGRPYLFELTAVNVPVGASVSLGLSAEGRSVCRQTGRIGTNVTALCWIEPTSATARTTVQGYVGVGGKIVRGATVAQIPVPPQRGQISAVEASAVRRCGNTTDKVWLTFDDGYISLPAIRSLVGVLDARHIRGRFFFVQSWAATATGRQVVAYVKRHGHDVENHSYSHPHLTRLSDSAVRREISRGPQVTSVPKLFRPPYGDGWAVARINADVRAAGYRVCSWTVDTRDWAGTSAAGMYGKVRYGDRDTPPVFAGGVVLMHMNHYSAAKLNRVIAAVQARGLTLDPK